METATGDWHVRRRWAPRHLGSDTIWGRFRHRNRRVRRRTSELGDVPDPGCVGDLGETIAVFVVVVVMVLFLALVGLPFLIALGELLLVVLLAAAGLVGRVLFRRPWTVDAVGPDGQHNVWAIVGWRASGAARALIADRLRATGDVPPDDEVAAGVLAP